MKGCGFGNGDELEGTLVSLCSEMLGLERGRLFGKERLGIEMSLKGLYQAHPEKGGPRKGVAGQKGRTSTI